MEFTLLPAVDVSQARVARARTAVSGGGHDDPLTVARAWQVDGAEWIHLVDLDAAFGRGSNAVLLAEVISKLDVNVELSGGIDDDGSLAAALATGCTRVVLGASALADPEWCARVVAEHGPRVAVALDVRVVDDVDGSSRHRLVPRGGAADVGELWETVALLDASGCARYVVTEANRDGTLSGPDLELYRAVVDAVSAPVISSGGVASIGDLVALAGIDVRGGGLEGAVVGRALLEGRFRLRDAIDAVRRVRSPT